MKPLAHNGGVRFNYIVTMEQVQKHAALSSEKVLHRMQETTHLLYELQSPEQRAMKYTHKPNKIMHLEQLRRVEE